MPRRNLNYSEKNKVLMAKDQNLNTEQIALKFKVCKSTVHNIINNKSKVKSAIEKNKGRSKRIVDSVNFFDEKIVEYIQSMQNVGFPITSLMIREKAARLANEYKVNIVASRGWFHRFKLRCKVKHGKLHGESTSVDLAAVENFAKNMIPKIMNKYEPNMIYNLDETAIFYRQLPSKTYFISKSPHFGTKIYKERVTLALCCNSVGDKLTPMIIGKSRNPKALRGNQQHLQALDVIYQSNSAAWMTKKLFTFYLQIWHNELQKNNLKVALIVDNFAGHKIDEDLFPNIEFIWLPPGTTSYLQPLDCGIIKSFKDKYLKALFNRIFIKFEQNANPLSIVKEITIFDAVCWIAEAWSEVSIETIKNCWIHAKFRVESVEVDAVDEEMVEEKDEELLTIYNSLPEIAQDKPTLVEYLQAMTISDHNSYVCETRSL
ncbi:tigger transposable element-derived protein 1-like [Tetranychus urticae]|uniref:tigger transposable element-derived protein 1-like n=1 Tax=Tetranychus urticae TaxID=32264 RepID=UPI00077BBB70|nr:tigger transposable element-derived protein 1-like [Tetranychus urticae]